MEPSVLVHRKCSQYIKMAQAQVVKRMKKSRVESIPSFEEEEIQVRCIVLLFIYY